MPILCFERKTNYEHLLIMYANRAYWKAASYFVFLTRYFLFFFFLFFPSWLDGVGLLIFKVSRSHSATPRSVGLLRTRDPTVAGTSTCTTHNTHKRHKSVPAAGFEPPNPSRRTATEPRLRPRDHRERHQILVGW